MRRATIAWLAAGALLVAAAGSSLRAAADLEIRPRWTAGDHQTLVLERRREQTGQSPARRIVSRGEVTITVVEATPAGYLVRWSFTRPQTQGASGPEQFLVEEIGNLMAGLTYELELDPAGKVKGLRNWADLRTRAEGATGRVLDSLRQRGVAEPVVTGLRQQLGSLFSSEDQLLEHGIQEARLYYEVFGRPYRIDRPTAFETPLASPFGGEPIPSRGEIALREWDTGSGAARIEWKRSADPEVTSRAMARLLTDWAARMGRPAPAPGDLPRVTMTDTTDYAVETTGGWVKSLTHVRSMTSSTASATATRTDTFTLTERAR